MSYAKKKCQHVSHINEKRKKRVSNNIVDSYFQFDKIFGEKFSICVQIVFLPRGIVLYFTVNSFFFSFSFRKL